MSYQTLRLEKQGVIARLTLDRPEVRNALDEVMILDFEASVEYTEGNQNKSAALGKLAPGAQDKVFAKVFGGGQPFENWQSWVHKEATAYSLFYLQERGAMMIDPQTRVYEGMIVGEHSRENDLIVNVVQGKKLSNVRASGKDDALILTPPLRMTLERAMSYIADDELVEVTPKSIRLRKRWLDPNVRKKMERTAEAV